MKPAPVSAGRIARPVVEVIIASVPATGAARRQWVIACRRKLMPMAYDVTEKR